MRLGIQRETFASPEDHSWLGSSHGVDTADSITLNGDAFLATFTDGIVPSGVVLGKVTATGRYAPYDAAAVDGSEDAAGHLLHTINLGGTTAPEVGDTPAALFWHGEVVEANLPTGHGLDAAAKTALVQIRFI